MEECEHENTEVVTIESEDYPDRQMLVCLDCGEDEGEWHGGRGIPEFSAVGGNGVPA